MRDIQTTQKLFVLCSFDKKGVWNDARMPGLPSWVPDFSERGLRCLMSIHDYLDLYSAEDTDAEFHFSEDFKVLTARGLLVDEIHHIAPSKYSMEPPGLLKCWLEFAATHSQPFHPTGMPWRQALFRTLITNSSSYGHGTTGFKSERSRNLFYEHAVAFLSTIGRFLRVNYPEEGAISGAYGEEQRDESLRDDGFDYFVKLLALRAVNTLDEHTI
jgi:hypothetical protein